MARATFHEWRIKTDLYSPTFPKNLKEINPLPLSNIDPILRNALIALFCEAYPGFKVKIWDAKGGIIATYGKGACFLPYRDYKLVNNVLTFEKPIHNGENCY